jgi:hypothetical protein
MTTQNNTNKVHHAACNVNFAWAKGCNCNGGQIPKAEARAEQNTRIFVEQDCTFEAQGRKFESGGAFVSPSHIIAYPKENGVLGDWHGNAIGTWRAVSTWKTPRSYMSSTMSQIEAVVDGIRYTGRGAGEGMIFKGKAKK